MEDQQRPHKTTQMINTNIKKSIYGLLGHHLFMYTFSKFHLHSTKHLQRSSCKNSNKNELRQYEKHHSNHNFCLVAHTALTSSVPEVIWTIKMRQFFHNDLN